MNRETVVPVDWHIRGVREQHIRAHDSLKAARRCKKASEQIRNLLAGVYFGRSIVELMWEIVKTTGYQQPGRKELERQHWKKHLVFKQWIKPKLPRFRLIYLARVHDFHRFGLPSPDPTRVQSVVFGPIRLTPIPGRVGSLIGTLSSLSSLKSNPGITGGDRALVYHDGCYYDEDGQDWVPLEKALAEYLEAMPAVIDEFERKLAAGGWS